MKRLLILALLVICASCGSKKKITEKEKVRIITKDSIVEKVVIREVPGVKDTVLIEEPCDSLGKIKPLNVIRNIGGTKVGLKTQGDSLVLNVEVDTIRSTDKTITSNKEKESSSEIIKTKEIVKFRWSKATWILLSVSIIEAVIIYFLVQAVGIRASLGILNPFK